MRKLWVMLCLQIEVDETGLPEGITAGTEALDQAWARVIEPDGPPIGLVEVVTDSLPNLNEVPVLIQGARIEGLGGQLVAEEVDSEEHEATTLAREDVEETVTGHTEEDKEAAA